MRQCIIRGGFIQTHRWLIIFILLILKILIKYNKRYHETYFKNSLFPETIDYIISIKK